VLDPVSESFRGGEQPGHVRVVEVAMGVDETGQQDGLAEVSCFTSELPAKLRPTADGGNTFSRDSNRAILDGGSADWENDAGAEQPQLVLGH